jgi:hypothetical protein
MAQHELEIEVFAGFDDAVAACVGQLRLAHAQTAFLVAVRPFESSTMRRCISSSAASGAFQGHQ